MDGKLQTLNHTFTNTYMPAKYPNSDGGTNTLTTEEWTRIVNEFNNTEAPYPKEKTLFGLFEEQVLKSPDAIALRKGDKTITYDELNKQSNRLAHLLIDSGILPEDNIGLLVTRDFEMIIGMMAILKSGGAYVPIDPEYPIDRQEYIFNQSLLKMVIADKDYPLQKLIDENKFIVIDFSNLTVFDDKNPGLQIDSKQLAYTIYTSGSTGRPKGVMIEHHSAVNLVLWVNDTYNVGGNDRLLFITSMCFDLSVYDIFGMLSAGGTLVIAESKEIQNVKTLQDMLVKYDITFWDSVPTTMDYLVRDLEREQPGYRHPGLKTVFLSGDWIPVDLPERMKTFFPEAKVISLGGATEATVWSNYFPVEQADKNWKSIPYGKPITNNFFYILDEQLQPVPMGVMGDLYIGGVGVARGYANDPEKTRNSFVPDPFNTSLGGVMYRTGDLGRMMPDLNMEFLGRKDNQVKIQGFRIELGEIESVLNSCEIVRSAVVLAKDDIDGKKMLVAYIVPKQKFDRDAVVNFLKTKLPQYMVPVVWIELEELPLTSNGKIDRKALPDHQEAIAEKKKLYVEPATETEKVMAALWKESMGIEQISVDDNFFELGGHSLMAVRILSKFEKKTGKNFQLSVLFKYPDVRSLSDFIDNFQNESIYTSLVPIKPSGTKTPLYIIHGEGLNILNFSHLATYVDAEQPIFGLQAKGLNGVDEPLDNLPDIAAHYLSEILQHNPNGPYLLAGYSFGGYVAVEMRKQLADMGKEVKMLMMFDTNAEKTEYKDWYSVLPKKVKRHLPRIVRSLMSQPINLLKNAIRRITDKIAENSAKKKEAKNFYQQIKNIKHKHLIAFRKYPMVPFDDKVYLYRADICVHYVNDPAYLGWKKFAKKGVELFHVPGDHLSMLLPPNVKEFASILQKSMDECQ
jgi:amino acid adenylation domain-containing protein